MLPTPPPPMSPTGGPDTRWELALSDGYRVTAPLSDAIRAMAAHLDASPITHNPGDR
jgi:hypothetical protein